MVGTEAAIRAWVAESVNRFRAWVTELGLGVVLTIALLALGSVGAAILFVAVLLFAILRGIVAAAGFDGTAGLAISLVALLGVMVALVGIGRSIARR